MPRDSQRFTARLAVAVAVAVALAASPVASGSPNRDSPSAISARHTSAAAPAPPPTILRVTTAANTFDWKDAAIGAGGGVALSMLAVGATLAISQRRTHHASDLATHTRRI